MDYISGIIESTILPWHITFGKLGCKLIDVHLVAALEAQVDVS